MNSLGTRYTKSRELNNAHGLWINVRAGMGVVAMELAKLGQYACLNDLVITLLF
jgi:hypothetical protein